RREQQRRGANPAPERRRVVLRVARGGVRERVEREGKSPPRRPEWPAPEAARVDQERGAEREGERKEIFQSDRFRKEREPVRVDQGRRHEQDEPRRPQ